MGIRLLLITLLLRVLSMLRLEILGVVTLINFRACETKSVRRRKSLPYRLLNLNPHHYLSKKLTLLTNNFHYLNQRKAMSSLKFKIKKNLKIRKKRNSKQKKQRKHISKQRLKQKKINSKQRLKQIKSNNYKRRKKLKQKL